MAGILGRRTRSLPHSVCPRKRTNSSNLAAASRDFGFTEGGRDSAKISLTDLGRDLAYAPNKQTEDDIKREAFQGIDIFRRVLDYYKGSKLPEMKYLSNTLQREFSLHPETHDEFSDLFRKNTEYLGIGEGFAVIGTQPQEGKLAKEASRDVVTLAEPEKETGLRCFVIMPFRERDPKHEQGFFDEVLRTLIVPAGRKAGFSVKTANRQGTEVIHSTIVNDLLDADLVVADLTEHNPNVLFELGMRMAHDKPVALIRSKGTGPIFDVDNMLRVLEYDPSFWELLSSLVFQKNGIRRLPATLRPQTLSLVGENPVAPDHSGDASAFERLGRA